MLHCEVHLSVMLMDYYLFRMLRKFAFVLLMFKNTFTILICNELSFTLFCYSSIQFNVNNPNVITFNPRLLFCKNQFLNISNLIF